MRLGHSVLMLEMRLSGNQSLNDCILYSAPILVGWQPMTLQSLEKLSQ